MIASQQIGFFQALWLLFRLQFFRLANQFTAGFRLLRKKDPAKRAATAGKSKQSWIFASFIALSMGFAFTNVAYRTVQNIKDTAGTVVVTQPVKIKPGIVTKQPVANQQRQMSSVRVPLPPAPGFSLPAGLLRAATFDAFLFLIAIMLLSIGNGELIRPDWDLEWQITLPVSLTTLLTARIFTRSAVNPTGLFTLWPFLSVLAWESGYETAAPFIGFSAALPLLMIAATAQTLCDTGFRLRLDPSRLRNLQALVSIVAVISIYLAISPGMPAKSSFILDWASNMPSWALWSPPGLAVQLIAAATPSSALQSFVLLIIETAICVILGVTLLMAQLRSGVVAAGARETGRRERAKKAVGSSAGTSAGWRFLTPIQRREIRLLGRDRTFFVQTLIMPLVFVGAQIFFNANGTALLSSVHGHPEYLASIVFGISAYALMFSTFQTLNAEGQALWILYCVPQSLESILRQKTVLWGIASLIYPVAIFSVVTIAQGAPSLRMIELAVVVMLGIPIFAVIGTALGVFACDPLAQTVQRRVKISYTYLYMLLSSTYIYSVYANSPWQRLSLLILTSLLAIALWQKARDHLPYLLDPTASPPARVSVSDGLIAALLFFVLQGIVTLFRVSDLQRLTGYDLLVAFSIAGAATFGLMRLAFWRLKSEGVPRTFGTGAAAAAILGVLAGLAAAVLAFIYLSIARQTSLFQHAHEIVLIGHHDKLLIAILAICAAPIFEEFIFRGLIFGGLRRSMGVTASVVASAAIFAIVHPPVSVIPVFGLGVVTALIYERTRLLIGSMAAHATYNASIVGFQFLI